MATAKKLPSGSWNCQVFSHYEETVQPDGTIKKKRIYKSFTCDDPSPKGKRKCEKMAADWAAEKETKIASNESMTFAQALDGYIAAKCNVLSPTTVKEYKSKRKIAYPTLLNVKLCDLDAPKVQIWVNQYAVGHAPKSVRNAYGLLTAAVSFYCPTFRIHVKLPAPQPSNLYTPSDSDMERLLADIKGTELETAIYLGAFCAMRMGEICALESTDIHGNSITICKSLALQEDGTYIVKIPKTPSSYRTIEAPDFVIENLSKYEGRIIDQKPYNITKALYRAQKRNGIPHFRFHDTRHYAASILHAIGIPDQYIMNFGGWKTDYVMKSVYRNVISEEAKKMNKKISDHFTEMYDRISMQDEMQDEN